MKQQNVSREPQRGLVLLSAMSVLAVACGTSPATQTPETTGSPTATQTPTSAPATPTDLPTVTAAPTAQPTGAPIPTTPESTPTPRATATPVTSTCPEDGAQDALHCEVEVRSDARGVPHIYAQSEHDLYFTQGYLAARDRLFQIEGNRLRALGRQAELFGASRLGDDLFMRALRFEDQAAAEIERWGTAYPTELRWLEAYIAGTNSYLSDAVLGRNGAVLPESFVTLAYVPEPFTAVQFLAMDRLFALSLGPDPGLELTMTLIKLVLPTPVFNDLLRLAPIEDAFTTVDAMEEVQSGGGGPRPPLPGGKWVDSLDPTLAAHLKPLIDSPEAAHALLGAIPGILQLTDRLLGRASNGWVVSGEHTASGAPLLANDAHVGVSLPNQFAQVHLNTADAGGAIDVLGLTLAGLPGVVFGHNRWVGWGVTTSFFDMSDLYLEVPVPGPTPAVLYNGQNVPIEQRQETFRLRNEDGSVSEEQHVLGWVPHHGAVMPAAALGLPEELVITLRWAGDQPGTVAGDVLRFNQARRLERISEIMSGHTIGAGNWHFASTDGSIGYDPRVRIPVRTGVNPLNPPWAAMPGTGGYEWSAETPWVPDAYMPYVYDPPAGIIVTCNNDPTGTTADGDPLNESWYYGATYASGMRAKRIDTWLRDKVKAGEPLTPEHMAELQGDNQSLLSNRLVPYLLLAADRRPELVTEEMQAAIEMLRAWDGSMDGDSVAATLYLSWWPRALFEVFADDVGEELFGWFSGDVGQYLVRPLVYFLDVTAARIDQIEQGGRFPSQSGINYFDDVSTEGVVETRDEQLLDALRVAVEHLTSTRGADMVGWAWAQMHTLSLNNTEGRWLGETGRGPYPVEGYGFSVNCTEGVQMQDGMPPSMFTVNKTSAYRQVLDFSGGVVTATNVLLGGRSERRDSPHYDDQIADWLAFARVPQPFYRDDVEADTESVLWLPEGFPEVDAEITQ